MLFRYYGSKAILFDEVVAQPFNRLIQDFIAQRSSSSDPKAQEHHIFTKVYELIESNRALFIALLSSKGGPGEEGGAPRFNGLQSFFEAGTAEQLQKYTATGQTPSFDMGKAVRLGFGMLAASVLLRDWLFPESAPSQSEMVGMLERLVSRALDPGPSDGLAG